MTDYQIIVKKPPAHNIIVNQKQGPQGDVTPEALAAKEAAEESAAKAKESEINAKESELNAKESEINAAKSADSAAQDAALVYSYVNAPAYDPNKTYNYNNPDGIPDIVVCDDGYAYRCISDNIRGEYPPTSLNWVRIPEVSGDLFVIVEENNNYRITQSLTPGKKESDFFEKKTDGSITFKPIVIDGTEDQRDFFPRQASKSRLGRSGHSWKEVHADEGYYDKLYSSLYNGYIPENSANKGKPSGYASLDANGKVPLTQLSDSVVTVTKNDVGLGNVDNTSDINKPISTATQTALNTKAPLNSPALTGTPTAPTAATATNNTQIATTAFVRKAIAFYSGLQVNADGSVSPVRQ